MLRDVLSGSKKKVERGFSVASIPSSTVVPVSNEEAEETKEGSNGAA